MLILHVETLLLADSLPPGDYSNVGIVILDQRGQPDLFGGYRQPLSLTDELATKLKPHVGKKDGPRA